MTQVTFVFFALGDNFNNCSESLVDGTEYQLFSLRLGGIFDNCIESLVDDTE